MNVQLKMHYLKGGEQYFGDTGSVYTLTRKVMHRPARTLASC
jgi:glycine betaine/proline transport system substrate-binding protein